MNIIIGVLGLIAYAVIQLFFIYIEIDVVLFIKEFIDKKREKRGKNE